MGSRPPPIDGVDLKLPNPLFPNTILVMADTGCRMAGAPGRQRRQPAELQRARPRFPWAFLASWEATFKPDLDRPRRRLVLSRHQLQQHLPGLRWITTSPNYETWGDTFDSWNADVLFPANPLLAAAPWVMTRGNHESCGRGARGWYALLDPYPYNYANVSCAPSSPGGTCELALLPTPRTSSRATWCRPAA